MASFNEFQGSVKLPGKRLYKAKIRLDFNARITANPSGAKWEGFSLRLFTRKSMSSVGQPEISIDLRPEEWLDLIDAMKNEYERAEGLRRNLDQSD